MKPSRLILTLCLIANCACPIAATASDAENLLPNADFDKRFSGWVAEDYQDATLKELIGGGRLFRIEEDGTTPCVVLEAEGDFSALTAVASIPCEVGTTYVLRYEVKSGLDGSRFIADLCTANEEKTYVRSSTTASPEYQILNAGDWQKQEVSLTGQEGDAYVFPHFIVRSGSSILIRNIRLEKAP